MRIILYFIVAVLGVIVMSWGINWFNAGTSVVGANNVKEQWVAAYDNYASLEATSKNVCRARKNEDAATDENSKLQLSAQRTAYEQNYERISAQYNSAMRDAFRAKLVKPSDLPDRAPTLENMISEISC